MPVTKKTYTPLIELPDVLVGRCSQVLPNRLQCWKGADYLVEEELPSTTPPPADTTSKKKEETAKPQETTKPHTPSLKQQQGEPLGQPGSGTTSEQVEQQKESKAAPPTTRSYQLCSMHTIIQQRADALALQEESSGRTQPDDSDPKSIHSKMMQAEQKARTSNMPQGS